MGFNPGVPLLKYHAVPTATALRASRVEGSERKPTTELVSDIFLPTSFACTMQRAVRLLGVSNHTLSKYCMGKVDPLPNRGDGQPDLSL